VPLLRHGFLRHHKGARLIPRRYAAHFFYSLWFIIFALMVAVRVGPWIFPGHPNAEPVTPAYAAEPRRTPVPTSTPIATPTPTIAPTPVPTPTPAPTTSMVVHLTFYTCEPFCIGDLMANGQPLDEGDVACGYALDTGQRFLFNGVEYTCEDRGAGPHYWVDFWKPTYEIGQAWQAEVGMYGTIRLLPR